MFLYRILVSCQIRFHSYDIMAGTLQPERKRKAIKWIFLQDFKSIMFAKKCTIDLSLFFGWLVYWFLIIKI